MEMCVITERHILQRMRRLKESRRILRVMNEITKSRVQLAIVISRASLLAAETSRRCPSFGKAPVPAAWQNDRRPHGFVVEMRRPCHRLRQFLTKKCQHVAPPRSPSLPVACRRWHQPLCGRKWLYGPVQHPETVMFQLAPAIVYLALASGLLI